MQVPLLDLSAQYAPMKEEILAVVSEICDSQRFILGPKVEAFEKELTAYCKSGGSVGVTSGSDALLIALMAEKIKPGDEIITSPFTFFATVGAIVRAGATPVFADIDPVTFNIDPAKIAEKITPRTRGIIPVHLKSISKSFNSSNSNFNKSLSHCAQFADLLANILNAFTCASLRSSAIATGTFSSPKTFAAFKRK